VLVHVLIDDVGFVDAGFVVLFGDGDEEIGPVASVGETA
jgi:hypothetical protein